MIPKNILQELVSLPTLAQGQSDDLKIDTDHVRVWLSRMTTEDGAPYDNQVTIEMKSDGSWIPVALFEAY